MSSKSLPSISIITATFNAGHVLPSLIASLKEQTDRDFEWIVADGGSTDNTLSLLDDAKQSLFHVVVDSRPDFGIYDALNRAIRIAKGDYYLVAGADDLFFSDAVANYKSACQEYSTDFVTARIATDKGLAQVRSPSWTWLYAQFAHVSGHAIGLAIRRNLHQTHGFYSRYFPIAADQLFILKAIRRGATIKKVDFIAGYFERSTGTSGADVLGTLLESYRVQVQCGESLLVQTIILVFRLLKNYRKISNNYSAAKNDFCSNSSL